MIHDFALTEKYVVLFDLPVTFSMAAARPGCSCPTPGPEPTRPAFGLLFRDGSSARGSLVRGRAVLDLPHPDAAR